MYFIKEKWQISTHARTLHIVLHTRARFACSVSRICLFLDLICLHKYPYTTTPGFNDAFLE